jgi:hypothetical protein
MRATELRLVMEIWRKNISKDQHKLRSRSGADETEPTYHVPSLSELHKACDATIVEGKLFSARSSTTARFPPFSR